MHHKTTWTHLLAAVASLGLGLALSAQGAAPAPDAKGPAKASAKPAAKASAKPAAKARPHTRPSAAELAKMPDMNSASKEQLMQLPGVTPAHADAIIKGRPYLTKAHLVTHKVIPPTLYNAIRTQIKVVPPEIKR